MYVYLSTDVELGRADILYFRCSMGMYIYTYGGLRLYLDGPG